MLAVCVRTYDKSVFAFEKTRSKVVADLVGFLRGYLTGLKGLPHLIGNHAVSFIPAGEQTVLPLRKKKFLVRCPMVTAIGGDPFAAIGLIRIASSSRTPKGWSGKGLSLFSGISLIVSFMCASILSSVYLMNCTKTMILSVITDKTPLKHNFISYN